MNCDLCSCNGTGEACPSIPGPYRQYGGTGPQPHPRFCELLAKDPTAWGPSILRTAQEDRRRQQALPIQPAVPRKAPRGLSDPVRVGFVCPAFYRGGAEIWHLGLMPRLDPARIRVTGLGIEDPAKTDPDMLRRAQAITPLSFGRAALRLLAAESDVLVTWGPIDRAAILQGLPVRPQVVSVCHGDGNCPFTTSWIYHALATSDHLVSCSEAGVAAFPESRRGQVKVIPNGVDPLRVDTDRLRHEIRAEWGVPEGAKVVGYLGRFVMADKRADLPVLAMRHLGPDWFLVMAGGGHEQLWIKSLAHDDPRIRFLDWIERPGDVLRGLDYLVNPSRIEGFGLSMAEAMLAGVPVIGTATGLAEGNRLALVRPIDREATPQALAEALQADEADAWARRSRVRRAQHVVQTTYGAATFANAWSDHLAQLGGYLPSRPSRAASLAILDGTDPPTSDPPGWYDRETVNRKLDNFSIEDRTTLGSCAYQTVGKGCCGGEFRACRFGTTRNRGGEHFTTDCVRCLDLKLPRPTDSGV